MTLMGSMSCKKEWRAEINDKERVQSGLTNVNVKLFFGKSNKIYKSDGQLMEREGDN